MSLDKNLFTLVVTPSPKDPGVVDLVDPSGTVHYRKQRIPEATYKVEVYDPASESLLVTVSAPSASSKHKTLELCNPTSVVELKYTGTISFRWGFKWEDHEFEWKREECFMIRKPDPPVLVAISKEPPGRIRTQSVQILDYNLNRFDINDRKGLEIVMLTALLTFQDTSDSFHGSTSESSSPIAGTVRRRGSATALSPPLADRPPPATSKSGVNQIARLQAMSGEVNDVKVSNEGTVEEYAQYCWNLLQDDAMLFVIIRAAGAEFVGKVLQVVHQTTRLRHKAGLDEDLHHYYDYDSEPKKTGPKRINLDDSKGDRKDKYVPPTSLTVHLSKIPIPELELKLKPKQDLKGKKKEEGKEFPPSKPPNPSRYTSPNQSSLSPPQATRPRLHSFQGTSPSPSPSQLSNPVLNSGRPARRSPSPFTPPIIIPQSPPKPPSAPPQPPQLRPRPQSFHAGAASAAAAPSQYSEQVHVPVPNTKQLHVPLLGTVAWTQAQGPGPALPSTAQKVVTGLMDRLGINSNQPPTTTTTPAPGRT